MNLRGRLRALVALVALVALALSLVSGGARAAMMRHYDLTSLAFMSDAVVRAKKLRERKVDDYTTLTTYGVLESYAGDIKPGTEIELDASLYAFAPPFAEQKPTASDEVFVFLERVPADRRKPGEPVWWITSSGLRIVLDGRVQRFEQWSNPGGFAPVPQRRDPWDLLGDPRAGAPLTPAEFAMALPRAIAKAAGVKKTIALPPSPDRTKALLDLLGPPVEALGEDRPVHAGGFGFAANGIGGAIVKALAETKDLHATLDALSRAPVDTFMLGISFPLESVLAAAEDRSSPLRFRLAAIGLLEHSFVFDLRKRPDAAARIGALLADPSREVRLAALSVYPEETASEATKRVLLDRFAAEKDDMVRIAVFERLRQADALDRLALDKVTLPLVAADRAGRGVSIAWTERYTDRGTWSLSRLSFSARRDDGSVMTQLVDIGKLSRHFSSVSGATAVIAFDKPLAAGRWTLGADLELEKDKRPKETRHFALGTVTAGADGIFGPLRSAPVPAHDARPAAIVDAGDDAGTPPSLDAGARARDAPTPPSRRSCGCSTPGAPPGSATPVALLVVLVLVRRRG